MKEIKCYPESIPEILINNLKADNCLFVFTTDTALNSWVEYLITHSNQTGTDVLPLENFYAWDNFKGTYLRAENTNSSTIPSILRKLFVLDLIHRNAEKSKQDRFQIIINPDDEYAEGAASFSDWICQNLSSLHFWKKRLEENKNTYGELDTEDQDYLLLYKEYETFLKNNNLYEPSWIENLDLGEKNKQIIIFYPELLEDFDDFYLLFSKYENITLVNMPEDIPSPKAYLYSDSRSELRQTILRIIDLVTSGKADWSEIALTVPDLTTYRPYIEREFGVYNVPVEIRAGVPLTKNSAGRIFKEISDCYNSNFSFDSVRSLLLDECVPWKSIHKEKREALVRIGNQMRCICSPTEKDIWFSAFRGKLNRLKQNEEQYNYYSELENFYGKIKHYVNQFFPESPSFSSISIAWQEFKSYFLESTENFSKEANEILGRCVSTLSDIIDIEKQFSSCNLHIANPYDFFLKELNGTLYTPQKKDKIGVNVFAYKLAGPAYFKYQFVIDSSQKNLELPYKRLTFLNSTKRSKLHLIEDDKKLRATEAFIKLYAKGTANGDRPFIVFSTAENTFSGFAIPHSQLTVIPEKPDFDNSDYILKERESILNPEENNFPQAITPAQKQEFQLWAETLDPAENKLSGINEKIKQNIRQILIENRNKSTTITNQPVSDNKLKITARGDLENYFPCPRKWLLKSVLKLHDDTLDTNLMQSFDMGNLNHKVLELYLSQFTGKQLPYYDEKTESFKIKDKSISPINPPSIDFEIDLADCIKKAILSPSDFRDSPLVINALKDQADKIENIVLSFLKTLLLPYSDVNAVTPAKTIGGIGNCTIVGCEKKICVPDKDFNWYGKIDCLLLSPENDWIIVDYKNSKTSIPGKKDMYMDTNGLLGDFQMPLYFKLIEEEKLHKISAGYFYSIKDPQKIGPVDKFVVSKGTNTATYELYKPTIKTLEYYASNFNKAADPDNKDLSFTPYNSKSKKDISNVIPYENCIKCSFKGICRTTYSVGGKTIENK